MHHIKKQIHRNAFKVFPYNKTIYLMKKASFYITLNNKNGWCSIDLKLKQCLIIICALCINKANAQIYSGGIADGFSVGCHAPQNNSIFNGGNADGFSVFCYEQAVNNSIFNGGNSDGFSVSCDVEDFSIFIGGDADGFSISCFAQEVDYPIFNGGNADGFSVSCFAPPIDDFPENSQNTAINNQKVDKNELAIYPNPTKGTINLSYNGDKGQIRQIMIDNVMGKEVYNSGSYQSIIDLSDKPGGVYLLHLYLDNKIITKKIVMEK
jgi:hypothetical protein